MTRAIEPVQTPDICLWSLSAEPPRIMGRLTCAAAGLLSNNRPGPVAAPRLSSLSPTTSQCWHILPVARPGQAAHCPGPRVSPVLFLVFSRFLSDSNTAELHRPQTCAHSLSATHSGCCHETRVVCSSLKYPPPWCVYLPGFWWFSRSTSCTPWVNPWLLSWHCKLSF